MTPMPGPGWFDDPSRPGQLRWWDGARWTDHVHVVAPAPPVGTGWPVASVPESRQRAIWPWLLALVVAGTAVLAVMAVMAVMMMAVAVPTFLGARNRADDRVARLNLERAAVTVQADLREGGLAATTGESGHSNEISTAVLSRVAFLAAHSVSGRCWAMVVTGTSRTTGEVVGSTCSAGIGRFRVRRWT